MAKSLLIRNIGTLATGDLGRPLRDGTKLYVEDGVIVAVGGGEPDAAVVVDAYSLTAIPGLIDGHVHPVFGEYSPVQENDRLGARVRALWRDDACLGGGTARPGTAA